MAFRADLKVCFGDIDNAGIVYYPRFLHYFHVALEEFFNTELRIDYAEIIHKHRLGFPTVHLESDFLSPLCFGDRIEVEIKILDIGQTSIKWGYMVYKTGEDNKLVVKGHNVTVCLKMDTFTKTDIPDWLRHSFETYQLKCEKDLKVAP